jgi:hypothetical protein
MKCYCSNEYVGLAESKQEFAERIRAHKLKYFCELYNKYGNMFYYNVINFYNNTSNFINSIEEYDKYLIDTIQTYRTRI